MKQGRAARGPDVARSLIKRIRADTRTRATTSAVRRVLCVLTSDFQVDHGIAGNAGLASGLERPARVFACVQVRHVPHQQSAFLDRILPV